MSSTAVILLVLLLAHASERKMHCGWYQVVRTGGERRALSHVRDVCDNESPSFGELSELW